MVKREVSIKDIDPVLILGRNDINLKRIKKFFQVNIYSDTNFIKITGEHSSVTKACNFLEELVKKCINSNIKSPVYTEKIVLELSKGVEDTSISADERLSLYFEVIKNSRRIYPRTEGQVMYFRAIKKNPIVFVTGPSGTGKSYIATAAAVESLKKGNVSRIILARPAVEAGEKLGFLPGDIRQKVDPYLRPLYDCLFDMIPYEKVKRFIEEDIIEIVPLAFMRGRTLNNAFIILDEAQNTTRAQMKMFLTRFGEGSKIIVTGDITQIDLSDRKKSGLIHAIQILKDIEDIAFIELHTNDIIRAPIVSRIVEAYETFEKKIKKEVK